MIKAGHTLQQLNVRKGLNNMDKFTILFLAGACAFIFIAWANAIKEDKYCYKALSILGYTAMSWFFLYGSIHVLIELVRI